MQQDGMLILVVGASGAGKDTLINGAREMLADDFPFMFPRRLITRPEDSDGEPHIAISASEYEEGVTLNMFALHWRAHGLCYGLPATVHDALESGRAVVVNVSRTIIVEAVVRFSRVRIIVVEAPGETIARRLSIRGRENEADQKARLARGGYPLPELPDPSVYVRFRNDRPRDVSITAFASLLCCLNANAAAPDWDRILSGS